MMWGHEKRLLRVSSQEGADHGRSTGAGKGPGGHPELEDRALFIRFRLHGSAKDSKDHRHAAAHRAKVQRYRHRSGVSHAGTAPGRARVDPAESTEGPSSSNSYFGSKE